jgi:hypothetical protein
MRTAPLSRWGIFAVLFLSVWSIGQAQDSLGMSRADALDYWQGIWDTEIIGNIAYVSGCLSGLHIMDLSNPLEPTEITFLDGVALGVSVSNNRAYYTSSMGGVVLDISNPTQPQELGRWRIGGSEDILVNGDIGVITTEEGCPFVVDVSDPQNVHLVGTELFAQCYLRLVGLVGDYFALRGTAAPFVAGLRLFDLSNPVQPVQVAAIDTNYSIRDAFIYGNYAYLAASSHGLRIVDLSNPVQPFVVATCDDSVNSPCISVTVTGDYAVVGKEWGINIWNVTNHSNPTFEGSLTIDHEAWGLFSTGTTVYAPYGFYVSTSLATVIDISNPEEPVEVGSFGPQGSIGRMVVSGTMAYVAGGWNGITIIDATNPDVLFEVECAEPSGFFFDPWEAHIAKKDDYLYMPDNYQSLFVVDIHDPTHPQFSLGWHPTYGVQLSGIIVVDDYAYLGDVWHNRLHIFNLADPSSPAWVDSLDLPDSWGVFGFATYGDYLCVAAGEGFYILSLTNPAAPQLVGTLDQYVGSELAIVGHYAYGAGYSVVPIIDLSNPSQPTLAGNIPTTCIAIAARANSLITADNNGLKAWDVTNPLNPELVGYYITHAEIENVEEVEDIDIIDGHVLWVSPYRFRAYECDALSSAPSHPEIIPHEFVLYPCYPNPFNPSTVIRFSLPHTEHAKLTIYDVTGRQVKVLVNEVLSSGEHRITFEGSSLSSGVYFARLEAGNRMKTEKMVLLK